MIKQEKIDELELKIEELKYKLDAAYVFIDMSFGEQAVKALKRASDMEFAVMRTDKLLTIHEPLAFEKKRKRGRPRKKSMNNPEYWIDNRSFEDFERDYENNTRYS